MNWSFLTEQNVQQRVHPVRPVHRRVNELGDIVQAGRMLPAARLVAPHESAQDAGVADLGIAFGDRRGVERGDGHILADEVNILIVFDQVFGDPGRFPVTGGFISERAVRRVNDMMGDAVVRSTADRRDLVAPGRRVELGHIRVDQPELPHVLEVLDLRVQPDLLKSRQVGDAAHVSVQVIALPLVHRGRQPVRLFPVQCEHHAFFGVHGSPLVSRLRSPPSVTRGRAAVLSTCLLVSLSTRRPVTSARTRPRCPW